MISREEACGWKDKTASLCWVELVAYHSHGLESDHSTCGRSANGRKKGYPSLTNLGAKERGCVEQIKMESNTLLFLSADACMLFFPWIIFLPVNCCHWWTGESPSKSCWICLMVEGKVRRRERESCCHHTKRFQLQEWQCHCTKEWSLTLPVE